MATITSAALGKVATGQVKSVVVHDPSQVITITLTVITVEEHTLVGGLGSAVAELFTRPLGRTAPQLVTLGVPDDDGGSSPQTLVINTLGLVRVSPAR